MKKIIVSLLLTFGLLVCVNVCVFADTDGLYTYEILEGKATITEVNDQIRGSVVIPSTLGGCPVTSIGADAFLKCTNITEITIPDGITSIGWAAFKDCSALTTITIPNSVTIIGPSAFYNCTSLKNIVIPNSVTTIGYYAFYDCRSLLKIIIPDSVISMGDSIFYGCVSLREVEFGNGLTNVGQSWFVNCTNLTDVKFGDSVTSIGDNAFLNCTNLTEITFPTSVISIGNASFDKCTKLKSITIPDGVMTIGNSTFRECTSLTSVTIPNTVTSIGKSVFEDCGSLSRVSLGNGLTCIDKWSFKNCDSIVRIIIPDNVESIEAEAFRNCQSLESIIIPTNVDSIGNMAFYNCDSLENVYFKGTKNELRALYTFDGNVELICNYIPATQIELNKNTIELHPGNTIQLTATMTPFNATYDYVVWSSNDTEVATVTVDGFVEILNEGKVTITATSVDGFLVSACEIEVTSKLAPGQAGTKTIISNEGKTFVVNPINVEIGTSVILALYEGDKIIETQSAIYLDEVILFTTTVNYTKAKVMVWNDFIYIKPICEVEIVK